MIIHTQPVEGRVSQKLNVMFRNPRTWESLAGLKLHVWVRVRAGVSEKTKAVDFPKRASQ